MTIDIDRAEIIDRHLDEIEGRLSCIDFQFGMTPAWRTNLTVAQLGRIEKRVADLAATVAAHKESAARQAKSQAEAEARIAALLGRKEAA